VRDTERSPSATPALRRVTTAFAPYRATVTLIAAVIVVTAGLGVVNPLLIEQVFDTALFVPGGPDLDRLWRLVGIMAVLPVVTGVLGIWQTYLANRVGQDVMRDLRDALYAHLHRMPLRFFTATRTGEIQARLAHDVGGVQSVVTDTAASVLSNTVVLISTVVAMLVLSWELTVLSLVLLPLFGWLTAKVGEARKRVAGSTQAALAEISVVSEETLSVSGMHLAKTFGRSPYEIERFRAVNRRLAGLQVRQQMIGRGFFALVGIFFSVTPAAVYLVAGLVNARPGSALSAGTIVAFTTLQARLFFPIGQMLQTAVEVRSSLALFERIFEYLDLEPDIVDAPDARPLPDPVAGRVELEGVRLRYEPDGAWALDGIDLAVAPGQLVAVVGPSGAGKSSLAALVPRLYDVTEGAVRIDGRDVRAVPLASLAAAVGMVSQDTHLFHTSVRDNLRYGRPDASDEEVEAAARAAAIHERILALPEGYDTTVGERGYRLSGGEKQRLAIARALLKDPRILILDEATSALDTTNERLIQRALQPLMAGRTTIAIAHRLSTILAADLIVVLDRGRVVERGTHAELLAAEGLYAQLYHQQFADGRVEALCADGPVYRGEDEDAASRGTATASR
jgi:ATP-binding cassette, subfamily B, bacterial